ncbi:MAG: hypothetical protein QM757_21830 [Paludibaculum sp.]
MNTAWPAVNTVRSSPQAHLRGAFENEVDLLLLLVVPGDLSAGLIEHDDANREVGGLNRAGAADQILRQAPGRIAAALNHGKIRHDHAGAPVPRVRTISRFVPS